MHKKCKFELLPGLGTYFQLHFIMKLFHSTILVSFHLNMKVQNVQADYNEPFLK